MKTETFTEILNRALGVSTATKCLSPSILNDLEHIANIRAEQEARAFAEWLTNREILPPIKKHWYQNFKEQTK